VKIKWKVDERNDGNVDLNIEDDNGVVERIVIHLPPGAPRQEMIDAAFRSIVADRENARSNLHKEHARLRARLDMLRASADMLQANAACKEPAAPPMLAELFISFLAPKNSAQGLLGDLQEMFQKNAERFGERQARRKYWIEVARSFGPLLWQWLKRIVAVAVSAYFAYFASLPKPPQ
jgi:hypothetical protein